MRCHGSVSPSVCHSGCLVVTHRQCMVSWRIRRCMVDWKTPVFLTANILAKLQMGRWGWEKVRWKCVKNWRESCRWHMPNCSASNALPRSARSASALPLTFYQGFGSRPSDHYFRIVSVGLYVCLFVCLCRVFLAVFDPISIKLGHMLYVWV